MGSSFSKNRKSNKVSQLETVSFTRRSSKASNKQFLRLIESIRSTTSSKPSSRRRYSMENDDRSIADTISEQSEVSDRSAPKAIQIRIQRENGFGDHTHDSFESAAAAAAAAAQATGYMDLSDDEEIADSCSPRVLTRPRTPSPLSGSLNVAKMENGQYPERLFCSQQSNYPPPFIKPDKTQHEDMTLEEFRPRWLSERVIKDLFTLPERDPERRMERDRYWPQ
ncbi:hypothetical protein EC973_008513 [Apophysomyces ossiformis]|uniref:Uncharacterized protein n=1 Tax=Apophysomyces ossiformis TaxID=679940 RepID=A0A8H7EQA6_9FUNG|nr:hypothetical protein EC973_008513 [Apophysomyces ossiformis]